MMPERAKLSTRSEDTIKRISIAWRLTEMALGWQLEGILFKSCILICCDSADRQVIIWKSDFKPEAKYEQGDSI